MSKIEDYNFKKDLGLVITYFEKSKILQDFVSGYKNFEKKIKIDGNEFFDIGSIGKSMFCEAIKNWKKEFFDEPLLPFFKNLFNKTKLKLHEDWLKSNLKIFNLTNHTTGIIQSFEKIETQLKLLNFYNTYGKNEENKLRFIFTNPPTTSIGKFNYSNIGYFILGYIIKLETNMSFENFMKKYLFKFNNFNIKIYYKQPDKDFKSYKENKNGKIESYKWDYSGEDFEDDENKPAGCFFIDKKNFFKYCMYILENSSNIELESKYLVNVENEQYIIKEPNKYLKYGLGWFYSEDLKGNIIKYHSGWDNLYVSCLVLSVNRNTGFFILSNGYSYKNENYLIKLREYIKWYLLLNPKERKWTIKESVGRFMDGKEINYIKEYISDENDFYKNLFLPEKNKTFVKNKLYKAIARLNYLYDYKKMNVKEIRGLFNIINDIKKYSILNKEEYKKQFDISFIEQTINEETKKWMLEKLKMWKVLKVNDIKFYYISTKEKKMAENIIKYTNFYDIPIFNKKIYIDKYAITNCNLGYKIILKVYPRIIEQLHMFIHEQFHSFKRLSIEEFELFCEDVKKDKYFENFENLKKEFELFNPLNIKGDYGFKAFCEHLMICWNTTNILKEIYPLKFKEYFNENVPENVYKNFENFIIENFKKVKKFLKKWDMIYEYPIWKNEKIFKGSFFEIGKQIGKLKKNIIPIIDKKLYEKYYPEKIELLKGISTYFNYDYYFNTIKSNQMKFNIFFNKKDGLIGKSIDLLNINSNKNKFNITKYFPNIKNKYISISYKIDENDNNFITMEGINENGLYIGMLNNDNYTFFEKGLNINDVIDILLLNCSNINECLNMLYNIPINFPLNFFIIDYSETNIIIEHFGNKNFKINKNNIFEKQEKYNFIKDKINTKMSTFNILKKIQTPNTICNLILDIKKKKYYIYDNNLKIKKRLKF